MTDKDVIKERQDEKKKFELRYFKERIVDYLAFLESNPIEHSTLNNTLRNALIEVDYAQQLLDGFEPPTPFSLPEGYRAKMQQGLIDYFAEGKDYSGYIYEQAEYEVEEMDDETFFDEFECAFCDDFHDGEGEEYEFIKTINDIKDKEKLEAVINE